MKRKSSKRLYSRGKRKYIRKSNKRKTNRRGGRSKKKRFHRKIKGGMEAAAEPERKRQRPSADEVGQGGSGEEITYDAALEAHHNICEFLSRGIWDAFDGKEVFAGTMGGDRKFSKGDTITFKLVQQDVEGRLLNACGPGDKFTIQLLPEFVDKRQREATARIQGLGVVWRYIFQSKIKWEGACEGSASPPPPELSADQRALFALLENLSFGPEKIIYARTKFMEMIRESGSPARDLMTKICSALNILINYRRQEDIIAAAQLEKSLANRSPDAMDELIRNMMDFFLGAEFAPGASPVPIMWKGTMARAFITKDWSEGWKDDHLQVVSQEEVQCFPPRRDPGRRETPPLAAKLRAEGASRKQITASRVVKVKDGRIMVGFVPLDILDEFRVPQEGYSYIGREFEGGLPGQLLTLELWRDSIMRWQVELDAQWQRRVGHDGDTEARRRRDAEARARARARAQAAATGPPSHPSGGSL